MKLSFSGVSSVSAQVWASARQVGVAARRVDDHEIDGADHRLERRLEARLLVGLRRRRDRPGSRAAPRHGSASAGRRPCAGHRRRGSRRSGRACPGAHRGRAWPPRAPSPSSATAMCSAVVDLPEPPFSLPITSTWARPGRAACAWAMLGLGAGWKLSHRCGAHVFRTAGFQPAHDHEAGWKPRSGRYEKRATTRAHAGLRIQTAVSWNTAPPLGQPGSAEVSALMPMPVSKLRLGQMPSTTTTPFCWPALGLAVHDRLAALVADLEPLALDDAEGGAILGIHHHRRPHLALLAMLGVSVKVELRKVRAGAATMRNGLSAVALSITSKWSGRLGISLPRGP